MDSQCKDHPLLLELNSLKSTVARFQDEAHASAVKLQRCSLDRANTHERAVILERENDWLKAELAILRSNPTPSSNSSVEQVQQLTLSLRRLSEKLTLTEDALSSKTAELAQANAELWKARFASENAYELAARARGREEAVIVRETELQWRLKSAEEGKMISLAAVGEYANLVRSLEARMGLGSSSTLVSPDGTKVEGGLEKHYSGDTLGVALANSLGDEKVGSKRLLCEFHSDTQEIRRQLGQLRGELEVLKSYYEAERQRNHTFHLELAKAQAELHILKIDDNTAAKMVSRYMQFSQTSTNTLQSTLSTLRTRHAATLSTLTSTSYSLASNLRSAENTIERLRTSLDELGRDIMKETYGRRREVALRVKFLGREEKMLEGLRRWLRKGEEAVSDSENEAENSQSRVRAALLGMTQDARILLESLDDGFVTDSASLSGSLARVVLAQGLVDGLVEELKVETARRMELEKAILQEGQITSPPIVLLNDSDINQLLSDEQESSLNVSFPSTLLPHPEVIPTHPPESQLDEAQQSTEDSAPIDPIALDTTNLTNKDDPILQESTDYTINAAIEPNPLPSHPHQSDNLTTNQVSDTVFLESAAAESPSVDIQLPLSSSIPACDTVIDADAAQPPNVCADIPNSVVEEAGIDKPSDSVVAQTDVASQDMDCLVGPSVVELGPQIELALDDSVSSVSSSSPQSPPSNLYSVVDPAVSSNPVTPLPTDLSTGQPPVLEEIEEPKTSIPHPLLAELSKISHRYDDFQRSFRDCHLALEGLKASLGVSSSNRQYNNRPPELTLTRVIPTDVLHAAVSRLDDYTEDVRVEVEIRISDEEVLAKGYEVLLCVPGALFSSSATESSLLSPSLQPNQSQQQLHHHLGEDQDFNYKDSSSIPLSQSELEIQVQAFITGTDPSVVKASEGFSKKLEDVQHDIAVLKRAIHNPDPELTIADGSEHFSSSQTPPPPLPATPETGGRGWASWIRSPSGPPFSASSAKQFGGLGSSSTFGSIMTSPRRMNYSPSLNQSGNGTTLVNGNGSSWMQGAGGGRGGRDDILGRLGLRVPMPVFDSTVQQPLSSSGGGGGWNGLSPTMPSPMKLERSVSSTMYMLGLGAPPMMTARSRGTSGNSSTTTGQQKGNSDLTVAAGNVGVESDENGMMPSRGSKGLVDVGRGDDKFGSGDEMMTDVETGEDEQDVDVE